MTPALHAINLGKCYGRHWALRNCTLERKVGRLSGGQQAQVALVMALAKRPDLLLLDIPGSARRGNAL